MLNKKGVSVILMVIGITAALIVVFIFAEIPHTILGQESTVKTLLAKDTSLLIGTMMSAPGNLVVYYPKETTDYIFSFKKDAVLVYKTEEDHLLERTKQRIIPYKDFQLDKKISHEKLYFQKSGQTITIHSEIPVFEKEFGFAVVDTQDPQWKNRRIIFSPKSINGELNTLADLTSITLNQITDKKTSELENIWDIQEADMLIELRITKEKQNTILLSIPTKRDYLKQNKKLATLLLNQISEKDTQKLITTKSISFATEEEAIMKSNIVVILEISEDISNKLTSEIVTAIPSAIQKYYE